ncbi:hypothetical protein [Pseudoalteromonas nigrifaciens]|uniref:hypothetical protein n=1 Tax=Pseudoalteromonas nigrifaciens TaxID=28109 RepID=UPI003FD08683
MKYEIKIHSTCLTIGLDSAGRNQIENKPFTLACGEKLDVGDKFTKINSSGSAGLPAILIENGWYQQYKGLLNIIVDNEVKVLALFDAYNIHTGESALDALRERTGYDDYYIAYNAILSQGILGFVNHTQNYRWTTCTGITRY